MLKTACTSAEEMVHAWSIFQTRVLWNASFRFCWSLSFPPSPVDISVAANMSGILTCHSPWPWCYSVNDKVSVSVCIPVFFPLHSFLLLSLTVLFTPTQLTQFSLFLVTGKPVGCRHTTRCGLVSLDVVPSQ